MRARSLSSRFLNPNVRIGIESFVCCSLIYIRVHIRILVFISHILRFLLYFLLVIRVRFFVHVNVFGKILISRKFSLLFLLLFNNVFCFIVRLISISFLFCIRGQLPKIVKIWIIFWWSWASPKIHILKGCYILCFVVFCCRIIHLFLYLWRRTFVWLNFKYWIKKVNRRCLSGFWMWLLISFF
jgi:hypothetical protein